MTEGLPNSPLSLPSSFFKCLQVGSDSETVIASMTVSRFVTLEDEIGIRTEELM